MLRIFHVFFCFQRIFTLNEQGFYYGSFYTQVTHKIRRRLKKISGGGCKRAIQIKVKGGDINKEGDFIFNFALRCDWYYLLTYKHLQSL